MGLVLQPQNSFTVVRQIANHTDSNTYFVQTVIRNAVTDVIIATLNLTDKGSQRFKKDWQVVADPSGQGFYVSMVSSVYTDSGYTTKSENYGDEENTYLIQERVLGSQKTGHGASLSMSETRRVFSEELAKMVFPKQKDVVIPEAKEDSRINTLMSEIGTIKELLGNIPTDSVNLSPLVSRLNDIAQAIQTKPVTPETNLKPVVDTIVKLIESQDLNKEEVKDFLQEMESKFSKELSERVVEAVTKATPNAMKGATFSVPMQLHPPEEEKEPGFDTNKLSV